MRGLFKRKIAHRPDVTHRTRRCERVEIDAVAIEAADPTALCAPTSARIAYLELAPERATDAQPAFWLGEGRRDVFDLKTRRAPPARLYRLIGRTEIFAKGLLVHEGRFIALDRFKFQELGRPDYPHNAPYLAIDGDQAEVTLSQSTRDVEGACLLLSAGGEQVWGHWLTDMLPRLGLAAAVPVPFRVIVGDDAPAWIGPLLARFGIGPERVLRQAVGREVLCVRDLYVPSFLRYANAFSPLANVAWTTLGGLPRARPRRLYVSRNRLPAGSTLANAADVERRVTARGYDVIYPERLNLQDQRRLFADATHVLGESGSGLHDTVFTPAGARVGVLLSPRIEGFVQAGIGLTRAQPTGFAFGTALDDERLFEMPIKRFEDALDRME